MRESKKRSERNGTNSLNGGTNARESEVAQDKDDSVENATGNCDVIQSHDVS